MNDRRVRVSDRDNDKKLLGKACRGDEAAFLLLYKEHREPIFRFVHRMLGSIEAAEDITHECFLSLIVQAGRFDPTRASLRTYLLAAARNLSFKHLRKYGGEVSVEVMAHDPQLSYEEAPLHRLISEERAVQVRNAISSLPPLQREVVILFQYEELSLAEIASVVGADVGTVKSRLHRAREGLRRLLASHFKSDSAVVMEGSY